MQLFLTGAACPLTIRCPDSFTFAQLADTVALKLDGRHDMVDIFLSSSAPVLSHRLLDLKCVLYIKVISLRQNFSKQKVTVLVDVS